MYCLSYIHFLLRYQLLYEILIIRKNDLSWHIFCYCYGYFFRFIISIRCCLFIKHIGFTYFQDNPSS